MTEIPKTNRKVAKARAKVGKEFGREGRKEGWQRDGKELGRSWARVGQSWTGIQHAVLAKARAGGRLRAFRRACPWDIRFVGLFVAFCEYFNAFSLFSIQL